MAHKTERGREEEVEFLEAAAELSRRACLKSSKDKVGPVRGIGDGQTRPPPCKIGNGPAGPGTKACPTWWQGKEGEKKT